MSKLSVVGLGRNVKATIPMDGGYTKGCTITGLDNGLDGTYRIVGREHPLERGEAMDYCFAVLTSLENYRTNVTANWDLFDEVTEKKDIELVADGGHTLVVTGKHGTRKQAVPVTSGNSIFGFGSIRTDVVMRDITVTVRRLEKHENGVITVIYDEGMLK